METMNIEVPCANTNEIKNALSDMKMIYRMTIIFNNKKTCNNLYQKSIPINGNIQK